MPDINWKEIDYETKRIEAALPSGVRVKPNAELEAIITDLLDMSQTFDPQMRRKTVRVFMSSLVRLIDAQAAIAAAEEAENEAKDYTELLRDNQKLTCQAVDAEYYGGMVDRIREILRYKHLDSFQKEIRIKQLLGED